MKRCESRTSGQLWDELVAERNRLIEGLWEIDWHDCRLRPSSNARFIIEVDKWKCKLAKERYALEYAQEKLKRANEWLRMGRGIDLAALERSARQSLSAMKERLIAGQRACEREIEQNVAALSLASDEADRLATIHRRLIGRLHPFLNPDGGACCKNKLSLARLALRRGDIALMRSIDVLTSEIDGLAILRNEISSWEDCYAELMLVQVQTALVRAEVDRKHAGADGEVEGMPAVACWTESRIDDMRREIGQCRKAARTCESRLRKLMEHAA